MQIGWFAFMRVVIVFLWMKIEEPQRKYTHCTELRRWNVVFLSVLTVTIKNFSSRQHYSIFPHHISLILWWYCRCLLLRITHIQERFTNMTLLSGYRTVYSGVYRVYKGSMGSISWLHSMVNTNRCARLNIQYLCREVCVVTQTLFTTLQIYESFLSQDRHQFLHVLSCYFFFFKASFKTNCWVQITCVSVLMYPGLSDLWESVSLCCNFPFCFFTTQKLKRYTQHRLLLY